MSVIPFRYICLFQLQLLNEANVRFRNKCCLHKSAVNFTLQCRPHRHAAVRENKSTCCVLYLTRGRPRTLHVPTPSHLPREFCGSNSLRGQPVPNIVYYFMFPLHQQQCFLYSPVMFVSSTRNLIYPSATNFYKLVF